MTGLTLGKYAPLHIGHQWLIDKALEQVDFLIVIVYDAPEQTVIPLKERANWLRALYPEICVIEADKVPKDKGYTEAIQQKHVDYILSLLVGHKIDKFFSSEAYGEKMSKALGCENILMDASRKNIQISGTEIRKHPKKYRAYMHPMVYESVMRYAEETISEA